MADIYAIIAYYLRHTAQVEEYLQEQAARAAEIRRKIEERYPTAEIRARMIAFKLKRSTPEQV